MSNKQNKFHYVQKAYLKNFSIEKKRSEVYQLDKSDLSITVKGVNQIALEENFYPETLEKQFNKEFETNIPKVFRKIIDCQTSTLSVRDRKTLSKFVNYHILRTLNVREQIRAEMTLRGKTLSVEEMRREHESFIEFYSDDYNDIMNLGTILFKSNEDESVFITSDTPVIITNYKTPMDVRTFSYHSDGGVILLPINPENVILFHNSTFNKTDLKKISHSNYFQTIQSNRYLYSRENDYSLIVETINKLNLHPWTPEERIEGIKHVLKKFNINLDSLYDLYSDRKRFSGLTWYEYRTRMLEYYKKKLEKYPKRPYKCGHCNHEDTLYFEKDPSIPSSQDRCLNCGLPIKFMDE